MFNRQNAIDLSEEKNCRNCGASYKSQDTQCVYCGTARPAPPLSPWEPMPFMGITTTTGGAWPTYNNGQPFRGSGRSDIGYGGEIAGAIADAVGEAIGGCF